MIAFDTLVGNDECLSIEDVLGCKSVLIAMNFNNMHMDQYITYYTLFFL